MSGIYIKGMEMPTSCAECGVKAETNCFVDYKWLLDHPAFYEERLSNCPLVSVPDHGRLIDADALMENEENISFKDEWHMTVTEAFVSVKNIVDAPTIIPADKDIKGGAE